jgi:hypothetical protein
MKLKKKVQDQIEWQVCKQVWRQVMIQVWSQVWLIAGDRVYCNVSDLIIDQLSLEK